MQFAFFDPKAIQFFLENYRFCRKSGNEANNRGWRVEGHVLCITMTQIRYFNKL